MENKEKFCPVMPIIIGSTWCLFGIVTYCFKDCGTGYDGLFSFVLLTHIAFFVFFICSILFSYKAFTLITKVQVEKDSKQKELENKIEWDKFQYNLNKDEREDKINHERLEKQEKISYERLEQQERFSYERIEKLIEKLENKDIVDNNALKKEFEDLKKDVEEWKLKKDQQLFVEIKKTTENNDDKIK